MRVMCPPKGVPKPCPMPSRCPEREERATDQTRTLLLLLGGGGGRNKPDNLRIGASRGRAGAPGQGLLRARADLQGSAPLAGTTTHRTWRSTRLRKVRRDDSPSRASYTLLAPRRRQPSGVGRNSSRFLVASSRLFEAGVQQGHRIASRSMAQAVIGVQRGVHNHDCSVRSDPLASKPKAEPSMKLFTARVDCDPKSVAYPSS